MVLSSLSPLFILWAIRGTKLIRDRWSLLACALMVILPMAFLGIRIWTAKKLQDRREIVVGTADDHRAHLLVYLFAVLLPFYRTGLDTWRDLAAMVVGLAFIVFLFLHLNLHYMNLLFAIFGYRVFTLYPPDDQNPLSGKTSQVLITPRVTVSTGDRIIAYRLSDTVYLEVKK
jgi:hypothetical protein